MWVGLTVASQDEGRLTARTSSLQRGETGRGGERQRKTGRANARPPPPPPLPPRPPPPRLVGQSQKLSHILPVIEVAKRRCGCHVTALLSSAGRAATGAGDLRAAGRDANRKLRELGVPQQVFPV